MEYKIRYFICQKSIGNYDYASESFPVDLSEEEARQIRETFRTYRNSKEVHTDEHEEEEEIMNLLSANHPEIYQKINDLAEDYIEFTYLLETVMSGKWEDMSPVTKHEKDFMLEDIESGAFQPDRQQGAPFKEKAALEFSWRLWEFDQIMKMPSVPDRIDYLRNRYRCKTFYFTDFTCLVKFPEELRK